MSTKKTQNKNHGILKDCKEQNNDYNDQGKLPYIKKNTWLATMNFTAEKVLYSC